MSSQKKDRLLYHGGKVPYPSTERNIDAVDSLETLDMTKNLKSYPRQKYSTRNTISIIGPVCKESSPAKKTTTTARNSAPVQAKRALQGGKSSRNRAAVDGGKKKWKFGLFESLFSRRPPSERLFDRLLIDKRMQSFSFF